jgi:hypothetical protein
LWCSRTNVKFKISTTEKDRKSSIWRFPFVCLCLLHKSRDLYLSTFVYCISLRQTHKLSYSVDLYSHRAMYIHMGGLRQMCFIEYCKLGRWIIDNVCIAVVAFENFLYTAYFCAKFILLSSFFFFFDALRGTWSIFNGYKNKNFQTLLMLIMMKE